MTHPNVLSCPSGNHTETLSMEANKLSGDLDDGTFGPMTRLVNLRLGHNMFSGPLPSSLSATDRIEIIQLNHNKFTGTVPSSWFDSAKPLFRFDVGSNALTGPIPASLGSVSASLEHLTLTDNKFSGQLPAELGQLSQLRTGFLNKNQFVGSIPDSFAGMDQIENLRLFENDLTGSVPAELCALEKEFHNDPENKLLIMVDCATGNIQCDCCHKCY